jgi:hypothetical protein
MQPFLYRVPASFPALHRLQRVQIESQAPAKRPFRDPKEKATSRPER